MLDSNDIHPMNNPHQTRPGDKTVNKSRVGVVPSLSFLVEDGSIKGKSGTSPLSIVSLVFIFLIAAGTLFLMLPVSHYGEGVSDPLTALFTATSAVTVTGLVVVDTADYWTIFGQGVILFLMFIGGLGFMSIAAFLLAVLGQRVSMKQRLLIRETLSTERLGGLQRLSVAIVLTAVMIQILGFVLLLPNFYFEFDIKSAIWQSLFHSVSGFNNAGFVILPEYGGLAHHQDDWYTLSILTALIFIGSLSFWVVSDVVLKRRFNRFSLVSKIVITMTISLTLAGSILLFLLEGTNPNTMADLPIVNKIIVSTFESVSGRTAGFSTLNYSDTRIATNLVIMALMFVGGATASVAGGIKVSTLFVVVLSIFAIVKEKSHVSAFGREIDDSTIRRSYAILIVCLAFSFICSIILALTNPQISMEVLTFEAVSAFGTVGLSAGATTDLNQVGKLIIIFTMFAGRIGPLLIGLKMVPSQDISEFRYPSENVTIG